MSVWGAGVGRGTDSAYSPLKVSYRRFSFPRDRPDVWKTKSANRDFFFVLHTPALSGPPPCISTSCSFFKKLGVCCPSQKNIVIYSHISLYTEPCDLTFFGENGKVRYSLDSRKFTRKLEILIYSLMNGFQTRFPKL